MVSSKSTRKPNSKGLDGWCPCFPWFPDGERCWCYADSTFVGEVAYSLAAFNIVSLFCIDIFTLVSHRGILPRSCLWPHRFEAPDASLCLKACFSRFENVSAVSSLKCECVVSVSLVSASVSSGTHVWPPDHVPGLSYFPLY